MVRLNWHSDFIQANTFKLLPILLIDSNEP